MLTMHLQTRILPLSVISLNSLLSVASSPTELPSSAVTNSQLGRKLPPRENTWAAVETETLVIRKSLGNVETNF